VVAVGPLVDQRMVNIKIRGSYFGTN